MPDFSQCYQALYAQKKCTNQGREHNQTQCREGANVRTYLDQEINFYQRYANKQQDKYFKQQ